VPNFRETANAIPTTNFVQLKTLLRELAGDIPSEEGRNIFRGVMSIVANNTDYFEAPASTRFHLNEEKGLFRHSLGVTYRLRALDDAYGIFPLYSYLDVILAGLLHDLGKAGQVSLVESSKNVPTQVGKKTYEITKTPYYVRRQLKSRPGDFEYKRNPEMVMMAIPVGSLHFIGTMLCDFWKPNPDVYQAIAYHDGMYVGEGQHVQHADCKLTVALHHADYWQSRVESEWKNGLNWKT